LRGHDVTLFEKEAELGGMLNVAVIPPHKEELNNLRDYLTYQMEILPVHVRCGEEFTTEKLDELNPDAVIMASGSKHIIPPIPGVDGENVVTAIDVLNGSASVKDTVVVIGGGLIGVETAEYLADRGRKVTVVEMLPSIAQDVGPSNRWGLLSRLRNKVSVMTDTLVTGITETAVFVRDKAERQAEIEAESVIIAVGLCQQRGMEDAVRASGREYIAIGSCCEPGQIFEAMADGFSAGIRV
ncbi:MAG: FAD-dependent oxidoreductase, partial [Deltaproteobacteria bacterium]|nr:FAD-dependent oxidoreductase [Deltaproteobacteria bacterium]